MPETASEIEPVTFGTDIRIAITVAERAGVSLDRRREPVTFGVPLPRGAAVHTGGFTLYNRDGHAHPTDARVLDRWPDGSVRWLLVDAQVDAGGDHSGDYHLVPSDASPTPGLKISEHGDRITIATGRTEFLLQSRASSVFERVLAQGTPAIDPTRSGLSARDEQNRPCEIIWNALRVEDPGTLRAVIAAKGMVRRDDGERLAELLLRLHFFADSPTVRMLLRVRNPRRAGHPRGYWDLGGPGSVFFEDLSLMFALPSSETGTAVLCSAEPGSPLEAVAAPLSLYQDSSGGENWKSSNHINRNRIVPIAFRGYRLNAGADSREGLRATPIVVARRGAACLAATMPHFWQNFPKAVEASDDGLAVRLFPGQYADVYELQGGEQKTHEVFFSFAPDHVTQQPLAWCRSRLVLRAEPDWYCTSDAMPYLTRTGSMASDRHDQLVNAAIEGDDTFERKREVIDEYGWRHFGDIYGDHEAVRHGGASPLVSHYNNQYDAIGGFASQFMRSSDVRWWTQMEELVAHVIDIDIYHTERDKWVYNHGLFWHTYHYGDADTATHRSYPRAGAAANGGGPSPDQNYTTGLMLHYFLTGDRAARETVVDSAQYVIDADDGRKTVFRWLDRGHTGFASASGSYSYHGPGRGPANSLNALLDGYRLTGRRVFLEKAEQLVRRCVHPADDLAALDLLDAERKWFYTMFLQVLGKYLDDKAERGEVDAMYAYAKATLLHYARWMAEHERPYLERPERLEFPTETWAAQDIRKSDVFYFAMKHADGAERERFRERGSYFHTYATGTLATTASRTLARPVVILLSNGWLHAWAGNRPPEKSPEAAGVHDFGTPSAFVPQRVRARKRVMLALAGAVAVSSITLSLLFLTRYGWF